MVVDGFVYLVCKAIRSSDNQKLNSFEILAASGDLVRAVDGARQIFCEMTRLQVNYQQYFCAAASQQHGNSAPPAWKASSVFSSPEPRGVAQACCGVCGRVLAEGDDISVALLPEVWAHPAEVQSAATIVSLEASCRRCHVCGAGEACSSGPDGVRCTRTALRVWVQRALMPLAQGDAQLYAVVSGPRESEVWNLRSAKCRESRGGVFAFRTPPSIFLACHRSLFSALSLPPSLSVSLPLAHPLHQPLLTLLPARHLLALTARRARTRLSLGPPHCS